MISTHVVAKLSIVVFCNLATDDDAPDKTTHGSSTYLKSSRSCVHRSWYRRRYSGCCTGCDDSPGACVLEEVQKDTKKVS